VRKPTAVVVLGLLWITSAEGGPNRYGHSDRVERHMLPAVSTGPQDPAWSPDGDWIAFSMRGDVWKVRAAGGEAIALTAGPAYHFEPAWSPDGQRIALSFDSGDGNLDIGVVSADGGAVTPVTSHAEVDVEPAWTRDGTGILFVSARSGRFAIYRHDLASRSDTVVATGIQPAVSPDGTMLAYVAPVQGRLGTGGIHVRPLAGGEARLVHYEESEYRMKPAWTPDGQSFLYVSDEGGSHDVRIVPVAGGNPVPLTADARDEFSPAVSPDGSRFAFVSNRTGPTTLHVTGMGGGPYASWSEVSMTARRSRTATGSIRIRVLDADGSVVPARIYVGASDGRAYAPDGGFHRVIAVTETHYFHSPGESVVEVPAGRTTIEAMRGHEYRPHRVTVDVAAGGTQSLDLRLERLVDLPARGWYSGDNHVHDLHQGRFGLSHEDFFLQLVAEDLHLTHALIHMDGTRLMGRWADLTGAPHPLSTNDHILQYGEEYRGSLGHIAMLGVHQFILPLTGGANNTAYAQPTLDLLYLDGARDQGGIAGYVHPFISPVDRPADAASSLIPLDIALGRGDFYDIGALYSDELYSAQMYYRFLNSGFRIAATGGTDNFSDVWRDPPPGADRTYVRIDGPLSVQAWLDGVRANRTFMSTGPLVFLDVNGHEPGDDVMLAAGAPAGIRVQAEALSIAPIGALEIIVNGNVAASVNAADSARIAFDGVVAIPDGGWIAARVTGPPSRWVSDSYAFAHTSPVWVTRPGRTFTSADDAAFLAQAVDALWQRVQRTRWRSNAEREAFQAAVAEARRVYEAIAAGGS